jgi:large subunit ribosomal protein L5
MATATATQPRLKARYNNTIKAQLAKDLGIENEMQIPKLDKIVINMVSGGRPSSRRCSRRPSTN